MPIPKGLRSFLKAHKVNYKSVYHTSAYTAQQLAHTQHISGEQVLKTVVLSTEDGFIAALLPACYKVDFSGLKKLAGKKKIRLGTEEEIRGIFPDCEIGAIPPFGNLYNIPVFADESVSELGDVLVAAGTHRDAIRVNFKDIKKWAKPKVGKIAAHL